ncbi:hypothetical protein BDV98DRAFT_191505 [Pterulicium gracile]|uniref:Uncharacterized protein n=1 Tax=Pterulicium gracile TaxID=1884261 RepID=A0A5C3QA94_9AGAR|nr:hypothetical protein BDV98DRAFT_191505 [Pterula gracilis]
MEESMVRLFCFDDGPVSSCSGLGLGPLEKSLALSMRSPPASLLLHPRRQPLRRSVNSSRTGSCTGEFMSRWTVSTIRRHPFMIRHRSRRALNRVGTDAIIGNISVERELSLSHAGKKTRTLRNWAWDRWVPYQWTTITSTTVPSSARMAVPGRINSNGSLLLNLPRERVTALIVSDIGERHP